MAYDYIKRAYAVNPVLGEWVRHTEMSCNNVGKIGRENKSQGHYVMVRFEGQKHLSPCHPQALEYHGKDQPQ